MDSSCDTCLERVPTGIFYRHYRERDAPRIGAEPKQLGGAMAGNNEQKQRERQRRREDAQRRAYEFLRGRNGADELSNALMILALVLALISAVTGWVVLALIALAALVVSMWRTLSRNIPARARERQRYRDLTRPLRQHIKLVEMQVKHRDKRYFLCKNCGTVLSVPRGKGKLRVTCPKCHTKTVQNS